MIELKQQLKLTPQLILTPQLKLVLKVLQLNTLELNEFLLQEAQTNPFLELEYRDLPDIPERTSMQEERVLQEESGEETEFWEKPFHLPVEASSPEEEFSWERILKSEESLFDYLMWQVRLKDFSPFEREIARFIVGNLDERGYLRLSVEEVAKELNTSVEKVEDVRKRLMFLDPVGVASRDLKECLSAQLEFMGYKEDSLPYLLVQKHLEELEKGIEYLSETYGYALEDLEEAYSVIRSLDPYPARNYFNVLPVYVEPDLVFYKEEGEWKVEVVKDRTIKVKINSNYEKILNSAKDYGLEKKEKKFLRQKFRDAEAILKALDSRYSSLYKVGEAILRHQIEFLEKGSRYLKPMTLKVISEATGLHESTVSRIISSKYVQTPQGLFSLKFFFSVGYESSSGESVSSKAVKEYIKELISKEDPASPLSDSAISKLLKEKYGIKIARRTVTKYREALGIPSARQRKKIKTT